MRVLTDPAETGAVCIALPQDVEGEAYDYPVTFFKKRVHRIERPVPSPYAIEEAVQLITRKKKPIMIFGGGVRYSEARIRSVHSRRSTASRSARRRRARARSSGIIR